MVAKKEFYRVREFVRILDISADRIYEALRRGDIKGSRVGAHGAWLIPSSELARLKKEPIRSESVQENGQEAPRRETNLPHEESQYHKSTIGRELAVQETQDAKHHDSSKFKSADALLPETTVRRYLSALMGPPYTYHDSDTMKVLKFFDYFSLEGNKYVIQEVQQACEGFLNDLDDLSKFMFPYFYAEPRLQNGDYMVRFDLGGRYDQDNPEHKCIGQIIEEKANKAYKGYINYRTTVKRVLFI